MTNTPSPTDEDRELIELNIARAIHDTLDLSNGLKLDMATEGEFGRAAKAVYDAVLESLLSDRAKLEEALIEARSWLEFYGGDYGSLGSVLEQIDTVLNRNTDRAT